MDDGTSSIYASILVVLFLIAIGWIIGQVITWRRLRHPVSRVSGDGGIDYLLHDVDYTITRDGGKQRTKVELKGHIYDFESNERIHVSVETLSPSRAADEMHRIHNAGAMICSLRPAEKRSKRKENSGDRPPVTVVPPEKD